MKRSRMTQSSNRGPRKSDADTTNPGLLRRIIENWLTSANERQYQIPFCQLLSAEGESVLDISTHHPHEKGKDILTLSPDGTIKAYQLKAGRIDLGTWHSIEGEINNLVELPV